jgi:hypothetical protein
VRGEKAVDAVGILPRLGPLGPVDPLAAAVLEAALDDAVLERVEGDHAEAGAAGEAAADRVEAALERAELVVHRDAERLEDAGRRVAATGARDDVRDGVGEVAGGAEGTVAADVHEMGHDADGGVFLAVFAEDADEFLGRLLVHDVGGRARGVGAHAHIERAVVLEREAAGGGVELVRGDADVDEGAADLVDAELVEHGGGVGVVCLAQGEAVGVFGEALAGVGEGIGVAVEPDDTGAGLEEALGVAAAAEGAIEEEDAGRGSQKADDLVGEDGNVVVHADGQGIRIFPEQVEGVVVVQAFHRRCVV